MASKSEWVVGRTEARSRGGMVAAKTGLAAEAGAAALARGGNAVDAAVVTSFVASVVEPWMNGLGGGGYMVIHKPGEAKASVVSYPMISAGGVKAETYKLGGSAEGFFGWPPVEGNINVMGPLSVAVPGTVAGMALALERFGTISLAEAVAPAIEFAERGFPVTWHTTLKIAQDLALVTRDATSRAIFTDNGNPWHSKDESAPTMLRQPDLARTLRAIADGGADAFYQGAIGEAIVDNLVKQGAPFVTEDLTGYKATVDPALAVKYRDAVIHAPGGGTGGTTLSEAMMLLAGIDLAGMTYGGADYLHHLAEAFKIAFADRFAYLADPDQIAVPMDRLLSPKYIDSRRSEIDPAAATPARAGVRATLGVPHHLEVSVPDYTSRGQYNSSQRDRPRRNGRFHHSDLAQPLGQRRDDPGHRNTHEQRHDVVRSASRAAPIRLPAAKNRWPTCRRPSSPATIRPSPLSARAAAAAFSTATPNWP